MTACDDFNPFSIGGFKEAQAWESLMRHLLVHLGVFGALFLTHIVAASLNASVAFHVVAITVSVQVVLFGPLGAATSPGLPLDQRRRRHRHYTVVGCPLALGLAWAYGGMAWAAGPFVGVMGAWAVAHAAMELQFSRRMNA